MSRFAIVLLATAAVSLPASAQQSAPTAIDSTHRAQSATDGAVPNGKDPIGLNATQRQMIAWSIAGLGDMQAVPPDFHPAPGTKVPNGLTVAQVPNIVKGVAPPAASYQYVMLDDQDLLFIQDGTIADVIHLDRRL